MRFQQVKRYSRLTSFRYSTTNTYFNTSKIVPTWFFYAELKLKKCYSHLNIAEREKMWPVNISLLAKCATSIQVWNLSYLTVNLKTTEMQWNILNQNIYLVIYCNGIVDQVNSRLFHAITYLAIRFAKIYTPFTISDKTVTLSSV